jgi:hypothetical protein
VSVPYVLSLTKGNFIFNFEEEKSIGFKKIKNMLYNIMSWGIIQINKKLTNQLKPKNQ